MELSKFTFTINKSMHYLQEITNLNHGVKIVGIACAYILSQLFDPGLAKQIIVAVLALPMLDYVTGTIGAYKKGEKIQSRGFYGSVVKIITYAAVIASCRIVESPIPELELLDNLAIKAIAITEIWSIIENFDKMGYVKNKQLKDLIRGVSK